MKKVEVAWLMSNLLDMAWHRRRQMKGETPKTELTGNVLFGHMVNNRMTVI